ncbi:MAG TPA: TspO/MBR family protein [Novosphingobium sp.]|nr:TspO/MBR family protein [Novosphingobium sp.]
MTEIASSRQLRAGIMRWAIVLVPAILLLGFLSAKLGNSGPDNPWFAALAKPGIYPPPIAFPVVWTLLYVLMGVALAMIVSARGSSARGAAIVLFVAQLLANLAWTPLFFGAHRMSAALVLLAGLDVLVLAMVVVFSRVRPVAAGLMLPYLAWVLFATLLNWQFLVLNPLSDGVQTSAVVAHIRL